LYAIVDIETTGTYAAANGITEVSIHIFDGNKVVEKYETLINPGQPIPKYIQAFTGITDSMVADAPWFEEVAERVYSLLHDKIFIAHNVNFDYSFLKSRLAACGFTLNSKRLCTVRLSRKIFPGFPSYSLGNLCHSLGIGINSRHRAGGDAEATVKIFRMLLQNDKDNFIQKSLLKTSKEQVLPPHVPKEDFDRLPASPGVYYFHNEKGKVVYVGKARNIRSRVNSHFSNHSESRQKQNFIRHVHSITFQLCATELMAVVMESSEIKRLWPVFNHSQKRWEDVYGIFLFEDQNGYYRLAIEKNKKNIRPVYSFHYLAEGHSLLRGLIKEFNLCPRLCFMQKGNDPCSGIGAGTCFGACESTEPAELYNRRVTDAVKSLGNNNSFIIVDKGLKNEEHSCILVEEGRFYGMGYVPADAMVQSTDTVKEYLKRYKENSFIRNTLLSYKARYPSKVIMLAKE